MNARPAPTSFASIRRWSPASLAGIFAAWLVLQIGGLFTPGLLDDVDSIYIQIAREMLQRHDFVTPTIDGIRFFDKPPLMYWMAAGSMHLFGIKDWAARLPLALGMLALLLAVYALGIRLYGSARYSDRAGFYAALALATSIGPYLYTRFYIPDILIALWMTLAVHCFLIALDRMPKVEAPHSSQPDAMGGGALLPMLGFGAVTALSVLTKGFIGAVFPVGFVLLYLAITRQLKLLTRLQPLATAAVFFVIAAPWHVLAALRNPAIPMPPGLGLPAKAGWVWFYLYNEHVARFLGRRIPHDYGQVPIPLFWLLLVIWLVPWAAFLPAAASNAIRLLRNSSVSRTSASWTMDPELSAHAALTTLLWAGLILGFFTLSSRQEYYHLPALPAVALMVGALLAAADHRATTHSPQLATRNAAEPRSQTLRASLFLLVPIGTLLALLCAYLAIAAPSPSPGVTLNSLLSTNPDLYNLSLGHIFDLTSSAMGFFRGPLITVALGMAALGPIAYLVRHRGHTLAANLLLAIAMTAVLLAAHEGLVRFNPILGSKDLAQQINAVRRPGELILIDGELTAGSTLLFYAGEPVHLVNGRINGPWFGSFWPDAPHIFEDDTSLHALWHGSQRIFLLTSHPEARTRDLAPFGAVNTLASSGGKTILTNQP